MTPTMDQATRKRFDGILGRLSSDHVGERAAAALLATRLLRAEGLTWADVKLASDLPVPVAPQWRLDLDLCHRNSAKLTAWERDFIVSLAGRASASPKQRSVLQYIAAELRGAGRA